MDLILILEESIMPSEENTGSFTIRNDGLSSLPKANRRGTFLGGSLGWRVSEESFFKEIEALSFISDETVRTVMHRWETWISETSLM